MEVGGTNRADPDAAAPVVVVVRTLYGTYRLVHQPFKSLLAGAHRLSSYSLVYCWLQSELKSKLD